MSELPNSELPIVAVLPELRDALRRSRNVVLQAAPGAGKSTRVPLELLDEPWLAGRKIVMLEPRRLATRAVARRMAQVLGEPLGKRVGYRMRLDSQVSAATRIEVVTEGVLAALLQNDPALEEVGCVIFDEFHERSLQADLGLALCLDVQTNLNEDLRILVMSATLAAEPVAQLLGDAPVVRSAGRSFPVEVRYAERVERGTAADTGALVRQTATVVQKALAQDDGDILVFLPGTGEIRRVQNQLETAALDRVVVAPLFGELAQQDQDRALQPDEHGRRKVVLATNIAETSLTIEGVRVVVDAGLVRRARFDPVSGMSRLETLRISRASAEQRCGRAGRLAAGVCYRLWTQGMQASLEAHAPAEIAEADLAPLALELAGWNVKDPNSLRWIDVPPAAAYAQARDLLVRLGALDTGGNITAHGREMLALRVHPRIAHLLLRARDTGLQDMACNLAALLGERDILRTGPGERDADLRIRLDAVSEGRGAFVEIDRGALERVRRSAEQYRRALAGLGRSKQTKAQAADATAAGRLLALAYPDRIARRRDAATGRYLLSNGRGAAFSGPQALARHEFLAVAELDAGDREARIFLAAPLTLDDLEDMFAGEITVREAIRWDSQQQAVVASRERSLGALAIDVMTLPKPDPAAMAAAMLDGIRALSLQALPWDDATRSWQARVQFVRSLPAEQTKNWPDVSDAALSASLEQWLLPWLNGITRRDHLARLDLQTALEALLDWTARQRLNELAPTHMTVPTGSNIRIDYLDGDIPSLSVRLQEMFGLLESPRIGGGTVPLLIKLLSPAYRPVQVTRDLASFWRNGYIEVRKELKGRYPKHHWPEDPFTAQAVRGARRPR